MSRPCSGTGAHAHPALLQNPVLKPVPRTIPEPIPEKLSSGSTGHRKAIVRRPGVPLSAPVPVPGAKQSLGLSLGKRVVN